MTLFVSRVFKSSAQEHILITSNEIYYYCSGAERRNLSGKCTGRKTVSGHQKLKQVFDSQVFEGILGRGISARQVSPRGLKPKGEIFMHIIIEK